MADVVTMPKLGFDMAEGTLISWAKKEGEAVAQGELLAEIETDKATVEVESNFSGTVRKHLVSEGAIVPVSTPIAVIGAPDEAIDFEALASEAAAQSGGAEGPPAAQQPAEQPPAEAPPAQAAPPVVTPAPTPLPSADGHLPGGVKASPLARRIAAQNGLDIAAIPATGPSGRVVKKDVEAYLAAPRPAAVPAAREAAPALAGFGLSLPPLAQVASSALGPAPADKEAPLSRLRALIGKRMAQSRHEAPHFYVTYAYDLGALMEVRRQANAMLENAGEKLSVNDFVVKAAALNLRNYPNLNARFAGDKVIHHGRVNVGVAVAVETGLLVVVCHDADRKPLRQISVEVKEKAGRARANKVQPDDIEGSTFSTSNLGMFGVEDFVAIINPPEAAILALGAAKQEPVVDGNEIGVGWRMKATISVDHRVSDGAEAAAFMQSLAGYLENPVSLILG
jgi:pyruvate dehydrogenase E2 component (dihydrolipoamide acetyltransferase)